MLTLKKIADLDVSAASGLVAAEDRLYVIADDENFLSVYTQEAEPIKRIALRGGELPSAVAARKRQKADYEALCMLPDGRLLALGSGSTDARMRGALIACSAPAQIQAVDLTPLYSRLSALLPELNIEGAVVFAERLWLLQRGNGQAHVNACIELDLVAALESLDARRCLDAGALVTCRQVALGALEGVPLSFTDLTAHPTLGLLFSACAEASPNTYDDGRAMGSILGRLSASGEAYDQHSLSVQCKVEGLCVLPDQTDGTPLRLVCDADDRNTAATLYATTWPTAEWPKRAKALDFGV